jgi:hypothetical protein
MQESACSDVGSGTETIFEDIMTWTTRTPTQPGWYWWRLQRNAPKQVLLVKTDMSVHGLNGRADHIDELIDGEWSSEPLGEPEEV